MNNPFANMDAADPLGFVKKLWGGMQVPGMVTPPMSTDELDKKIQDLKTVETWLSMNMNMLRSTIQALEVQRATLATLKSMSESFAQQTRNAAANAHAAWPMSAAAETDPPKKTDTEPATQAATQPNSSPDPQANGAIPTPAQTVESSLPFANPAAWWNVLQEQFKQAVSSAIEAPNTASTTNPSKASKRTRTSSATKQTKPVTASRKSQPASTKTTQATGRGRKPKLA